MTVEEARFDIFPCGENQSMITIVNADGPLLPMTRDLIDGVVEGLRPQVVSAETTEQGCTFLVNMSPDALTVEENMFKAFGISRVK